MRRHPLTDAAADQLAAGGSAPLMCGGQGRDLDEDHAWCVVAYAVPVVGALLGLLSLVVWP